MNFNLNWWGEKRKNDDLNNPLTRIVDRTTFACCMMIRKDIFMIGRQFLIQGEEISANENALWWQGSKSKRAETLGGVNAAVDLYATGFDRW